jgi:hypothetical protein
MEKRINPVSEETLDDFFAELGILEECETLALAAIEKDLAKRAKKQVFAENVMVA